MSGFCVTPFSTDENLFDANRNLFGVLKFFLLKFSIGLIVLQGLVCEFLISFGDNPYHDDDKYSKQDKTIRGYCMFIIAIFIFLVVIFDISYIIGILVLLEYVILTLPYLIAFGYKITKSEAGSAVHDPTVTTSYSFCGFICEILKVHDVFGVLNVDESVSIYLFSRF